MLSTRGLFRSFRVVAANLLGANPARKRVDVAEPIKGVDSRVNFIELGLDKMIQRAYI